jgi:hypothetical protein
VAEKILIIVKNGCCRSENRNEIAGIFPAISVNQECFLGRYGTGLFRFL